MALLDSSIWHILSRFKGFTFLDMWCWVALYGKGVDLGIFSMIAWSLWLNINSFLHEGRLFCVSDVTSRAFSLWDQFKSCQQLNVDAGVVSGFPKVGIRVVARDDQGLVLHSQFSCVERIFSPHVAEVLAAKKGMLLASKYHWSNIILESDASVVIKSINLKYHSANDESIISSIRDLGSKCLSFQVHCRRSDNGVAHLLASSGLHGSSSFVCCSPKFISSCVRRDLGCI